MHALTRVGRFIYLSIYGGLGTRILQFVLCVYNLTPLSSQSNMVRSIRCGNLVYVMVIILFVSSVQCKKLLIISSLSTIYCVSTELIVHPYADQDEKILD